MYIKCAKCGDSLRLYGEGIADTCSCPKEPIGIYIQNGKLEIFGPQKKFQLMEPEVASYTSASSNYYKVEVYRTIKMEIVTKGLTALEAAEKVEAALDQEIIDREVGYVINETLGNVEQVGPSWEEDYE